VNDLFRTASEVQCYCVESRWEFCFIGGLALQRWGEPRVTRDVDLTLLTGFRHEERYVDALLTRFAPRIDDARQFALHNRVLLLRSQDGVGIDVALGGLPFEEQLIARSMNHEFLPGVLLRICTAEDLIVLKAFADRPRDWSDVEGIVVRQTGLDWPYIDRQLRPLVEVKESPHILERLRRLRKTE
jgi:hypothetical protein